jgi:hypothetical protein
MPHPSRLPQRGRLCLGPVYSSRPQNDGNEVDHRGEACIGFFVARRNTSKRFDLAEEVFDDVGPLVLFRVMHRVSGGPFAHGTHSLDAAARQILSYLVCIERLVADDVGLLPGRRHDITSFHVLMAGIACLDVDQIAERIDECCNLRGQTATRFADGLIAGPPFVLVPC